MKLFIVQLENAAGRAVAYPASYVVSASEPGARQLTDPQELATRAPELLSQRDRHHVVFWLTSGNCSRSRRRKALGWWSSGRLTHEVIAFAA